MVSASLLWSMSEWLDWHRLSVRECLSFLDGDRNGVVSVEELQNAVDFMNFEDQPPPDAVRQTMLLIMPPNISKDMKVEVECAMLQMALVVVSKQLNIKG